MTVIRTEFGFKPIFTRWYILNQCTCSCNEIFCYFIFCFSPLPYFIKTFIAYTHLFLPKLYYRTRELSRNTGQQDCSHSKNITYSIYKRKSVIILLEPTKYRLRGVDINDVEVNFVFLLIIISRWYLYIYNIHRD